MRKIAVFDFDGTITQKDTLLEFIKFAFGKINFYMGFALYSPIICLMFLKLFPNWKCKEIVLGHYVRNMSHDEFQLKGQQFAEYVSTILRPDVLERMQYHIDKGHEVYIVSASIEDWIVPFVNSVDSKITVLATKLDVDAGGFLTGKFATKNCHGVEKVNRLISYIPELSSHRDDFYIYAYGDSRGDREMMEFVDEGMMV